MTISILGSDDQKELFFKEFDMIDQLSELYRSQGRFRKLYSLWVENGELISALDTAISYSLVDDIPIKELEIILHYLQAGTLFTRSGDVDVEMRCFDKFRSMLTLPPSLRAAASLWDSSRRVLISFNEWESFAHQPSLRQSCVKDFLSLFVGCVLVYRGLCWLTMLRSLATFPISYQA